MQHAFVPMAEHAAAVVLVSVVLSLQHAFSQSALQAVVLPSDFSAQHAILQSAAQVFSVEKESTVFMSLTVYMLPALATVSSSVAGVTFALSYSTIAKRLSKSTVADFIPSVFDNFFSMVFAQPMAQVMPSMVNSALAYVAFGSNVFSVVVSTSTVFNSGFTSFLQAIVVVAISKTTKKNFKCFIQKGNRKISNKYTKNNVV